MRTEVAKFMIGLPFSGKSKQAEKYMIDGVEVINYDEFSDDLHSEQLRVMDKITECIEKGLSFIIDGCNSRRKIRRMFISHIERLAESRSDIKYNISADFILTPVEVCVRNWHTSLAKFSIDKMMGIYKKFNIPIKYEGFQHISIVRESCEDRSRIYYKSINMYLKFADTYDQKTVHHKLTLGAHSRKAGLNFQSIVNMYRDDNYISTIMHEALLLHDCGKISCSDITYDEYGKETATYYGHEYIGAYESLFYNTSLDKKDEYQPTLYLDDAVLLRAIIIELHMIPFTFDVTDKLRVQKFISKFKFGGDYIFDLMNVAHICDIAAK